jgi:alanyl-tRNA synthetase
MNQFKDVFLGTGKRDYTRCVDTQKCLRVSGKHNDLEEVGHDGTHHTFFEMMGNWSFGDYGKKEAITWAWELFTKIWKLQKDKLWATVYKTDDEAYELWRTETDIDRTHILRFGEKDNFWEMGDTGPCGPCSEIHIDLTENGCKAEDINSGINETELWNLVFIQYNRDEKGELHDLPKKHVDTGMGFERVVSVLQNKSSNYETDIFLPLINELINITGKEYSGKIFIPAMNVIADHIRALSFAIADGGFPSNEGRGYVLRRILRRAARYGRNLGMRKPFIYNLVDPLVEKMGGVFPEIKEKRNSIKEIIKAEEESFNETLDRGLVFFNEEIEKMRKSGSKVFSGEVAFKLHDTYGFPVDLTQLMAREIGFSADINKFDELMKEQKDRARSDRESSEQQITGAENILHDIKSKGEVIYNPYDVSPEGKETEIIEQLVLKKPDENLLELKENPFYKEAGGQVNDSGKIVLTNGYELDVIDIYSPELIIVKDPNKKPIPNLKNQKIVAKPDYRRRRSIQRNHSATHLVHEALRRVLGPHIRQMGSYLDDKLLRFDFPHYHKVTDKEIKEIEDIVNEKIMEDIIVGAEKMPIEQAEKIPNIKKYFGEKYGDVVRVITMDPSYSIEFCGGTHVTNTGDIGLFKIVKEESVSSGIRRIFARTGEGIVRYMDERVSDIEQLINELPEKYSNDLKPALQEFKVNMKDMDFRDIGILTKILEYQDATINSIYELREKYLEERKQAEKQLAKQKVKQAVESLDSKINSADSLDGVKIVTSNFVGSSMDELKEIGDSLRMKIGNGVGVLYSIDNDKVNLVAIVSDNLIKDKSLNAGKIANDVAKILGGGGGGRPHLATAGGKDVTKIDLALGEVKILSKNI